MRFSHAAFGVSIVGNLLALQPVHADVLQVPLDYPTIQAAIDDAAAGDVVLVADGDYVGAGNADLNLGGKAISVESANGPGACRIIGSGSARGFIFESGETDLTTIDGFTIINCAGQGAGMFISGSSPVIRNCILENNTATDFDLGGGVHALGGAPRFVDCTFRGNHSTWVGGNVFLDGADATFDRCIFEGGAAFACGGVFLTGSSATLTNCMFVDNNSTASNTAAGLYLVSNSEALVVNCTFVGNTVNNEGNGAILVENSDLQLYNSILWSNTSPGIGFANASMSVEYCIVEGGFAGTGNVDVDPAFVDAGNGDFRLTECSPAQDSGDASLLPAGVVLDLDGLDRVHGPDVDMGVFESTFAPCADPDDAVSFPGLAAGDEMGTAVAAAGDVNNDGVDDFMIASPFHDGTDTDAGLVEVISGADFAVLFHLNGAVRNDRFGSAITSLGDINGDSASDFAIGAPYHDAAGSSSGRVVVYSGLDGMVLFTLDGEQAGDHFGESMAGGGDIDGDTVPDLLIGAPFNDEGGHNAGKVYAYSGATGAFISSAIGRQAEERFGWALDIVGNTNGDIFADVIIGAPRNADNGTNAGKAYVLAGPDLFEIRNRRGKRPGDQFGRAVGSVGDVTGDGFDDYAVTSPYYDTTARSNTGRIYVYSGENGSGHWSAFGAESNEWFGISMARAGDVNDDGRPDVLIGAPVRLQNSREGVVEVWSGAAKELLLAFKGQQAADQYGYDIAGLGDIDNDGILEALIGAPTDNAAGIAAGRAEIVDLVDD